MRLLASLLLFTGALIGAATEEFPTSAGPVRITPIFHASLMLQAGGKVLYVDPAQGVYDGRPKADYILITDNHGDHFVSAIIDKVSKDDTVLLAPKVVAEKMPGSVVISNGESKTLGPFKLDAIPMYNMKPGPGGQVFHEKGRGNGYILTYGGKRFYFAGDTEGTPEMRALKNIDVAFIPMNLPYTDDAGGGRRRGARVPPGGGFPVSLPRVGHPGVRESAGRHGHRRAAARLVRAVSYCE